MDDALQYANQGADLERKVLSSVKGNIKSYIEDSSYNIATRLGAAALLGILAVAAVPDDLMAEIYGKVYDDFGNPLQGAVVVVNDAGNGTHSDSTNIHGEFNIPEAEMAGATVQVLHCPGGTYTAVLRQGLDNGQWDFILMKHDDGKYNTYGQIAWDQWRELFWITPTDKPNSSVGYHQARGLSTPIYLKNMTTEQEARVIEWLDSNAAARETFSYHLVTTEPNWNNPGGIIQPGEGFATTTSSDYSNPNKIYQVKVFAMDVGSFADDIDNRRGFAHELNGKANGHQTVSYPSALSATNSRTLYEDSGQAASYLDRIARNAILVLQLEADGRRIGNTLYHQVRATPCQIEVKKTSLGKIKSMFKE